MFKANRSYVSLRRWQKDFSFSPDGVTVVPRASIEIDDECPTEYKQMLMVALDFDWVRPVANMRETEYTMELLKK
jgi:hypothetical protein